MKVELGEYIYRDIEKNTYLIKLYTDLLKKYTASIFNLDGDNMEICIEDLLRFADILSKSTNNNKKEFHQNIAQTIVVLLSKIYPENENIQKMLFSVLYTVNNYRGIKEDKYYYTDIREFVSKYIEKSLFKINNSKEEYFVCNQKEIYDNLRIHKCYSYSGPTSMGKTFIIKEFIINQILSGEMKNYVIVVPTKALISEITSDFINELGDNLKEYRYRVINSYNDIKEEDDLNYIMIYTQERFLMHLTNISLKIDYVFIDEAHKIFYKDKRSMYFYKIIDVLNSFSNVPNIIFSAPLIENPDEFLKLLPNTIETSSKVFKFSPVSQQKFIIDYYENCVRVYNDLTASFIELDYDKINNYDINLLLETLGKNTKNIVYCDNKKEAITWSKHYADSLPKIEKNDSIEEVERYIADEIHKDYYLIETLKKGVAYHVGYVPTSIRKRIENLYKDKYINTIFCTSTLLEGVNLPADNLFIPIKSNSNILKKDIDFKNLIGRVGRIKYNLSGNVFIIPKGNDDPIKKCSDIIQRDITNQTLSIHSFLTNSIKKEIINELKKGKTELKKRKSFDELDFSRFIMNALIHDIKNDYKSNIFKQFKDLLKSEDMEIIKNRFELSEIPEDMPITRDQISNIDMSILEGEEYPIEVNYNSILYFLERLHTYYKWDVYESSKDIGNKNKLRYYAVILNKWMNGFGLKQIIDQSIKNKEESGEVYMDRQRVEYTGSSDQINSIINDTLDTIENIILYKIANYFLKFSERCKEKKKIEKLENDWYNYIQYGTKDSIVIQLQKYGFSREASLKIKNCDKYIIFEEDKILISKEILEDRNIIIVEEAQEVFLNNNKIFK